jgi:peptide/nickel transport system substrate-binding protein
MNRPTVLLTIVGFLALACGGPDEHQAADGATITVLFDGDERAFGPAADNNQKFLVFLAMVQGYRDPTNRLADRRDHSTDYRAWTYHLRPDVRWHDGVPVTAHDVAFTLDLFRHPDVLYAASQGVGDIESVMVLDDYTMTVTWRKPNRHGLDGWTQFYPRHLLEDLNPTEFYQWEFWKRPVGDGPYRYVRHVPRTMIELEANPDFYAGKPKIERVVLKLSTANKVTELTSGNVDVVLYLKHSDVRALKADPRFRIYYGWAFTEPWVIYWNHRHPLFADPTVRQALTLAIDRHELLRILDFPEQLPVVGGLSPWDRAPQLYREGKLDEGLPYDPEAARRLLDRVGWVDRDGNGTRERDGVEARFTLLSHNNGLLTTLEPAILIQDQLRRVGIRMDIQPVQQSAARAAFRSGDYDAEIDWFPNWAPELLQRDFFGTGSKIGYQNPEMVRLMEVLADEFEPDDQDALYAQINEILVRDMPVTFLFPLAWSYAVHRRVRGLSNGMHPLEYMEQMWIDDEG